MPRRKMCRTNRVVLTHYIYCERQDSRNIVFLAEGTKATVNHEIGVQTVANRQVFYVAPDGFDLDFDIPVPLSFLEAA